MAEENLLRFTMDTVRQERSPVAGRRWLAYSLRSLAILIAIAAVALTLFASQIREYWNGRQLQVMEIQTVNDLHDALSSERAAIYFDVDWSINAAVGRRNFNQFVLRWRQEAEASPARFYVLNLTHREKAVVVEALDVMRLRTQGSGEILWIRDGKPAAFSWCTDRLNEPELMSFAQRHFATASSQPQ
jgi:hypothetical protein